MGGRPAPWKPPAPRSPACRDDSSEGTEARPEYIVGVPAPPHIPMAVAPYLWADRYPVKCKCNGAFGIQRRPGTAYCPGRSLELRGLGRRCRAVERAGHGAEVIGLDRADAGASRGDSPCPGCARRRAVGRGRGCRPLPAARRVGGRQASGVFAALARTPLTKTGAVAEPRAVAVAWPITVTGSLRGQRRGWGRRL